jgi:hypothetical protein
VWSVLSTQSVAAVTEAKATLQPLLQRVRTSMSEAVAGELLGQLFFGSWDKTTSGIHGAVATGLARLHRKAPRQPLMYLARYFGRRAEQEASAAAFAAGRQPEAPTDQWESDDEQPEDRYHGPRVAGLTDNAEIANDAQQLARARLVAGLIGSEARCAFFGRNLHSRMPLVPTPARLKRAGV